MSLLLIYVLVVLLELIFTIQYILRVEKEDIDTETLVVMVLCSLFIFILPLVMIIAVIKANNIVIFEAKNEKK